jgi:hypothetical protein
MTNISIKYHKNCNFWSHIISSLFCIAIPLLCLPGEALAATVTLQDNAHVLDASKIQAEVALLSDPVDIYTTATFEGTTSSFDQNAQSLANQHTDHIIIDIDTTHRHIAIEGGASLPLSYGQYNDAVASFHQNIHGSDYTSATIAALNSLKSALTAASTASSASPTYTPSTSDSYTPSTYTSSSHSRSRSSAGGGLWIFLAIVMVLIGVGSRLYRAANGIPEPPPSTYHHHYSDSSWNDSSSSSSSWSDSSSSSSSSWSDSSSSSSSWSDNSSSGGSSDFGGGGGASGDF